MFKFINLLLFIANDHLVEGISELRFPDNHFKLASCVYSKDFWNLQLNSSSKPSRSLIRFATFLE